MRHAPALRKRPFPLPYRLLVMALAVLQFVAPTWHVCAMGGHAMSMAGGMEMAGHHQYKLAPKTDGSLQPFVCFCAGDEDQNDPNAPKLDPVFSHGEHVNCLALLLQTMPGAVATVAPLIPPSTQVEPQVFVAAEQTPFLFVWSRFRGRAPPVAI